VVVKVKIHTFLTFFKCKKEKTYQQVGFTVISTISPNTHHTIGI
jgi:hypothetical protein